MIGPALPEDESPVTDPAAPWVISDQLSNHQINKNKRLKSLVAKTPWLDRWEFAEVGERLLSAKHLPLTQNSQRRLPDSKRPREEENPGFDEAALRQALDRVCVWKVRMDNKLPHAVESSHQLAQVLWRDYTSTSSTEEIRLSYSCAILRAINGLADALQQQRSSAQSVAVLTAELGIPSWLVDCRHEATHNQMPKLGVLRLAATTLLEYFDKEYWQPQMLGTTSTSKSDSSPQKPTIASFVELLVAYKQQQSKAMTNSKPCSTSQSSSSSKKFPPEKPSKVPPKQTISATADTGSNSSSSDDNDDEEMYLDSFTNPDTFWRPPTVSLGTNANRFAALQEPPKKKKTKQKKAQQTTKANKEPSAHHYAKKFVKHGAHHLELAYQAALLFLVWGGVEGVPEGLGALIPESTAFFPETQDGIQNIQQCFGTLLVVLGKEWPGFLRELLVHLVDSILSIEKSAENSCTDQQRAGKAPPIDADPKRKFFFLESWVRFLISRDFLVHFHPNLKNSRTKDSSVPAPWSFLEQMRYPLNSLCDRLTAGQRSTTQSLAGLFLNVLGPNRIPDHGLEAIGDGQTVESGNTDSLDQQFAQGKDDIEEGDKEGPSTALDTSPAPGKPLSLQELEAMLSGNNNSGPEHKNELHQGESTKLEETTEEYTTSNAGNSFTKVQPEQQESEKISTTISRPAWVRCTAWDPCAIGALPGYPCSS